jgi:dolichyl-phosphate-mannose--protein O-mannosyl transferase
VLGLVLLVYLTVFLIFDWVVWHGIGGFVAYHRHVIQHNLDFPASFPNASPFWSWPLLLRPYAYWSKNPLNGSVEVLWCGGNPLLWWAIIPAILIAGVRGYTHRSVPWIFVTAGYVANMAMWIPIHRYLFIYSYMPALYFGLLALCGDLEQCWIGNARRWEHLLLLAPLLPCLILGLRLIWAALAIFSISIAYLALSRRLEGWDGKFVCLIFVFATLATFAYFLPLWVDIPLSQTGYMSRMWLNGQGLANWL